MIIPFAPPARSSFVPVSVLAALLLSTARCNVQSPESQRPGVTVRDLETGTTANLIGLSAVDANVWWAGGAEGTVLRTTDGGDTWAVFRIAPGDSLQFRDVHAFDSDRAYVLSIGPGDQSRIYHTSDGGLSWSRQWTNDDPDDFFDCFDFWSPVAGLAIGDANDDRIALITTYNGTDWERIPDEMIPGARGTEGGFAASGTCLVTSGDSLAWIATGSPEGSRVYRTNSRGREWSVSDVDFIDGLEAAGLMSLAFRTAGHGFAAGGALTLPDEARDNLFETRDGGLTWTRMEGPQLPNVYGLAVSPGSGSRLLLAVGPKGLDASADDGSSWWSVDKRNYWSVQFIHDQSAVAVGPRGRISRVDFVPMSRP